MSNQNNSLQQYTPRQVFKSDNIRKKFEKVLGQKANGFVTSVLQVINDNDMLSNADPESVLNAAMTAAVLDLPVNPNLGFAYIIPYKLKGKGVRGQFQMGYKGFIQLAQRSGLYKTISASPIYEGQIIEENPLTGFKFNFDNKTSDKVVGYAAYFELLNGFQKTLYMTVEEVEDHAKTYSQAYQKGYGPWKDDFPSMAIKTVLKLLLSKFGPLSIDMEKAIQFDQGEVKDVDGMEINYIDNDQSEPEQPTEGRQKIDTQQGNEERKFIENETPLYDEVMGLGKKVHSGDWFKESKVLADNLSDGRASFINELNEDELKKAKKILEMGVAEEEG